MAQEGLSWHDVNGHNVFLLPSLHGDDFHVRVMVPVGSIHGPPGVAHFIEHMMFHGQTDPSGSDDDLASKLGALGEVNAGTSLRFTDYEFTGPAKNLRKALTLWGQQLLNPVFAPAAIKSERAIIHSEGLSDHGSTGIAFRELFFRHVYGENHPLGFNGVGTSAQIEQLNRRGLITFHRLAYKNLNIIVSGPFAEKGGLSKSQTLRLLAVSFPRKSDAAPSAIAAPDVLRTPEKPRPGAKHRAFELIVPPKHTPSLTMLFRGPRSKDLLAVTTLERLLNHDNSKHSLIQGLYKAGALDLSVEHLDLSDEQSHMQLTIYYAPTADPKHLMTVAQTFLANLSAHELNPLMLSGVKSILQNEHEHKISQDAHHATDAFEDLLLATGRVESAVAAWQERSEQISGLTPLRLKTVAKALFDAKNLYIGFEQPSAAALTLDGVQVAGAYGRAWRTIDFPVSGVKALETSAYGLLALVAVNPTPMPSMEKPKTPKIFHLNPDDPRVVAVLDQQDKFHGELGLHAELVFGALSGKERLALEVYVMAIKEKNQMSFEVYKSSLRELDIDVSAHGLAFKLAGDPGVLLGTLPQVLELFKHTKLRKPELGRAILMKRVIERQPQVETAAIEADETIDGLFLPFVLTSKERLEILESLSAVEVSTLLERLIQTADVRLSVAGAIGPDDLAPSVQQLEAFSPEGLSLEQRSQLMPSKARRGRPRGAVGFLASPAEIPEYLGARAVRNFGYGRLLSASVPGTMRWDVMAELTADYLDSEIFLHNRERLALGYVHGASYFRHPMRPDTIAFNLFGETHRAGFAQEIARGWDEVIAKIADGRVPLRELRDFLDSQFELNGSLPPSALDIATDRLRSILLFGHPLAKEAKSKILEGVTPAELRAAMAKIMTQAKNIAEIAVPNVGQEAEAKGLLDGNCKLVFNDAGEVRRRILGL